MQRIKIELPEHFSFTTSIPVRITDVNYGGHVGNDTVLSIIHEARMQFLRHLGFSELDLGGTGIIMSDVGIQFKYELFYGDVVLASVAMGALSKIAFDLYYKLEKESNGVKVPVAAAKTGMVCFDYERRKLVPMPEKVKSVLLRL
ncbi:MAG TPA: thioesterase family protein [Chitinophagaceae bacterium]|nr:thioesterase family protein [Chitinophagaceae bacterium]